MGVCRERFMPRCSAFPVLRPEKLRDPPDVHLPRRICSQLSSANLFASPPQKNSQGESLEGAQTSC